MFHLKSSIQSRFKKDALCALNQAVNATFSTGISMLFVIQNNVEIPALIGILSLLVSLDTYGATLKSIFEVFCAMYGILITAIISGSIGSGNEIVYGFIIFAFLLATDILDDVPLRCKLAQVFGFVVLATATMSNHDVTNTWLLGPRTSLIVVLGISPPLVLSFLISPSARVETRLRLDEVSRGMALVTRLLISALLSANEERSRLEVLHANQLLQSLRRYMIECDTLLVHCAYEFVPNGWRKLKHENARKRALEHLQTAVHGLERCATTRIGNDVRELFRNDMRTAIYNCVSVMEQALVVMHDDGQAALAIHDSVKSLLEDYFTFRTHLYQREDTLSMGMGALEALQFCVFNVFNASRLMAQELAGGGSLDWFGGVFDSILSPSAAVTPTIIDLANSSGDVVENGDSPDGGGRDTSIPTLFLTEKNPSWVKKVVTTLRRNLRLPTLSRVMLSLRLALCVTATSLLFLIRQLRPLFPFGVLAALTVLLVLDRSLGASLRRCLHRVQGTSLGAFFSFIVLSAVGYQPPLLLAALFCWVLVVGYARATAVPSAAYAHYVAAFTPIVLLSVAYDDIANFTLQRIEMTFIGVVIAFGGALLPMPAHGERAHKEMLSALGAAGRACRATVSLGALETNELDERLACANAIKHLAATIATCSSSVTLFTTEPVLWRKSFAADQATKVVAALNTVQRRLDWCLLCYEAMMHPKAAVELLVRPMANNTTDVAQCLSSLCSELAHDSVEEELGVENVDCEDPSLDDATSRQLRRMRRAVADNATQYRNVIAGVLASHIIRIPTRDSLAFAAWQFTVNGLGADVEALAAAVSEFEIASTVLGSGVAPLLTDVASSRRSRRSNAIKPVIPNDELESAPLI